jgi:hypothetical protein
MTITRHGMLRLKQRSGVGKSQKKMERLALNAYEKGIGYDAVKGRTKMFMKEKKNAYGSVCDMKIYGGFLYIFDNDRMITMYPLPGQYVPKAKAA